VLLYRWPVPGSKDGSRLGIIAMISPVALILARKWMVAGMKQKHEG